MSRGPGKWQRAILERISRGEIVTIPDILEPNFENCRTLGDQINADWSCRVAIERAIKTLAKKELICLGWGQGFEGAYRDQWVALPLSVDYPTQHLDTKDNSIKIFPADPGADARSFKGIHRPGLMLQASNAEDIVDAG